MHCVLSEGMAFYKDLLLKKNGSNPNASLSHTVGDRNSVISYNVDWDYQKLNLYARAQIITHAITIILEFLKLACLLLYLTVINFYIIRGEECIEEKFTHCFADVFLLVSNLKWPSQFFFLFSTKPQNNIKFLFYIFKLTNFGKKKEKEM